MIQHSSFCCGSVEALIMVLSCCCCYLLVPGLLEFQQTTFRTNHKFKIHLEYFLILFRDTCSDGMNGYISPCAGDTHPPIFRSPVSGMEDILDNEVM